MDFAATCLLAGQPRGPGCAIESTSRSGETPMSSKVEARVVHHFKATAERVYDAWLTPEQVRAWLGAALKSMGLAGDIRRIDIDARVGGKFFFSDLRDGNEARHWGTYLKLDRPRTIVFTWIVDESDEAN